MPQQPLIRCSHKSTCPSLTLRVSLLSRDLALHNVSLASLRSLLESSIEVTSIDSADIYNSAIQQSSSQPLLPFFLSLHLTSLGWTNRPTNILGTPTRLAQIPPDSRNPLDSPTTTKQVQKIPLPVTRTADLIAINTLPSILLRLQPLTRQLHDTSQILLPRLNRPHLLLPLLPSPEPLPLLPLRLRLDVVLFQHRRQTHPVSYPFELLLHLLHLFPVRVQHTRRRES